MSTQGWNSGHTCTDLTLSNGSPPLTATCNASTNSASYGVVGATTGKKYWEVAFSTDIVCGIGNTNATVATNNFVGQDANAIAWYIGNGATRAVFSNNATVVTLSGTNNSSRRMDLAADLGAGLIWFRDELTFVWNNSISSADPVTGVGGISIPGGVSGSGNMFPGASLGISTTTFTANFATASWVSGAVPSGYGPWDIGGGGGGGGTGGGIMLFGGSIGWTPSLIGAAALWRAGNAIRRNATLSRRKLLTGK